MSYLTNREMLRDIECPTCQEPMKTPIYMCILGHSMCGSCYMKLHKCPICSKKLLTCRNWVLESITNKIFYPCPNSDSGCDTTCRLHNLDKHAAECSYRIYKCPLDFDGVYCTWEGRNVNLTEHFGEMHPDKYWITNGTRISWNKNKGAKEVQVISALNEIFWLHRIQSDRYIKWAIQYMGSKDDSENYHYDLKVFNEDDVGRHIRLRNGCLPDFVRLNEIFSQGKTTELSLDIFCSFANKSEQVWFTIMIGDVNNTTYEFLLTEDELEAELI